MSRILGRAPLHRYADPLGAMNLAVMHEGDALGWHFDQTDFVVSLAIQPSDGGRRVRERAAPALDRRRRHRRALRHRRPRAGRRRARARHHRADDAGHAHALRGPLVAAPGHAGASVDTPRHVALFGYDTKPGTMSSELLKLVRYGRSEPEPQPA